MANNSGKLVLELLTIFVGVTLAFALQNWSDNKRNSTATDKILLEIKNGLQKDIEDLDVNLMGHKSSLRAAQFYTHILSDTIVPTDSIFYHYFYLTRDYISVQNKTGYETLKSRGLELVKNDSLRKKIISFYDFDYEILEKMEEEYSEMQFTDLFYHKIHDYLAPHYTINTQGTISGIPQPLPIPNDISKKLLQHINRIRVNRTYMVRLYTETRQKALDLIKLIDENI